MGVKQMLTNYRKNQKLVVFNLIKKISLNLSGLA